MKTVVSLMFAVLAAAASAQSYTSYLVGDVADVETEPFNRTVLAGGGGDSDAAMISFLSAADGGDVVVLRASGSDGYNDYLYADLGITVNSVETIVFNDASAAGDDYVQTQIANAEAIFIAGGDQSVYVEYWKDNAIEDLLNNHEGPIGGTSAGMAILSETYFSAENGTVYSDEALEDPFNTYMTLGHNDFLTSPNVWWTTVTDTHLDDPDRKGRLLAFFARKLALAEVDGDWGEYPMAIGCEEYTAFTAEIDVWWGIWELPLFKVYGEYPAYDDYAYLIFPNCAYTTGGDPSEYLPEVLEPGQPLTWNQGENAVNVLRVAGTEQGTLVELQWNGNSVEGYQWQRWWVIEGELFTEDVDEAPACGFPIHVDEVTGTPQTLDVYPNPANTGFSAAFPSGTPWRLSDGSGRVVVEGTSTGETTVVDVQDLASGTYFLRAGSAVQRVQVAH